MKQLDRLTDLPKQQYIVPLDDGSLVTVYLEYMPRQQLWKLNVSSGDFTANGITMTSFPNILRQFKNIITFGILVISNDGIDPRYIDDFTTGRVRIFMLSQADVELIEKEFIE